MRSETTTETMATATETNNNMEENKDDAEMATELNGPLDDRPKSSEAVRSIFAQWESRDKNIKEETTPAITKIATRRSIAAIRHVQPHTGIPPADSNDIQINGSSSFRADSERSLGPTNSNNTDKQFESTPKRSPWEVARKKFGKPTGHTSDGYPKSPGILEKPSVSTAESKNQNDEGNSADDQQHHDITKKINPQDQAKHSPWDPSRNKYSRPENTTGDGGSPRTPPPPFAGGGAAKASRRASIKERMEMFSSPHKPSWIDDSSDHGKYKKDIRPNSAGSSRRKNGVRNINHSLPTIDMSEDEEVIQQKSKTTPEKGEKDRDKNIAAPSEHAQGEDEKEQGHSESKSKLVESTESTTSETSNNNEESHSTKHTSVPPPPKLYESPKVEESSTKELSPKASQSRTKDLLAKFSSHSQNVRSTSIGFEAKTKAQPGKMARRATIADRISMYSASPNKSNFDNDLNRSNPNMRDHVWKAPSDRSLSSCSAVQFEDMASRQHGMPQKSPASSISKKLDRFSVAATMTGPKVDTGMQPPNRRTSVDDQTASDAAVVSSAIADEQHPIPRNSLRDRITRFNQAADSSKEPLSPSFSRMSSDHSLPTNAYRNMNRADSGKSFSRSDSVGDKIAKYTKQASPGETSPKKNEEKEIEISEEKASSKGQTLDKNSNHDTKKEQEDDSEVGNDETVDNTPRKAIRQGSVSQLACRFGGSSKSLASRSKKSGGDDDEEEEELEEKPKRRKLKSKTKNNDGENEENKEGDGDGDGDTAATKHGKKALIDKNGLKPSTHLTSSSKSKNSKSDDPHTEIRSKTNKESKSNMKGETFSKISSSSKEDTKEEQLKPEVKSKPILNTMQSSAPVLPAPSEESKPEIAKAKPTLTRMKPPSSTPTPNEESKPKPTLTRMKPPASSGTEAKPTTSASTTEDEPTRKPIRRAPSSNKTLLKMRNVLAQPVRPSANFKPPRFHKEPSDETLIEKALRKNVVFEALEESDVVPLIKAFEPIDYDKGKLIIKQGDKGDYFYIIAKGKVKYEVNGTEVGAAGKGKSFGELALLYSCPRAATVVAATQPTKLFRVDRQTFNFILRKQTKESEEEKRKLLKGVSFLKDLAARDLNKLCTVMTPRMFGSGDTVIAKGDAGDAFYILKEGEMRVTNISVGTCHYEDVTLTPGDYFGELALVTGEPRAGNVVGITPGTAFSIEKKTFCDIMGTMFDVIMRAQDKLKLGGIKAIKELELDDSKMDILTKSLEEKNFWNKPIFEEGKETEAALYFVREGKVEITSKDKSKTEIIKPGGYFGDEMLLADSKGITSGSCMLKAEYTAKVGFERCSCGVLTLETCREIFDTKAMGDTTFDIGSKVLDKRSSIRQKVQSDITLEALDRHRILGEGQFGEVWLVSCEVPNEETNETTQEFALKIQMKEDRIRQDALASIKREVSVLRQLNHPFIVDLVHTYEDDDRYYMLMEPVKGGELWNVIHKEDEDGNWESGLSEDHAKFYALVVADTLAHIHREGFIFRDLKPENVLIDPQGYPIIVDFGFAKYVPDKTHTFCGTPNYLAPELVLNSGHAAGVDHWALGVLIYEMVSGENPFYFEGMDQVALLQAICHEKIYPLPETSSTQVVNLVDGLLEKEPDKRMGSLAGGEKQLLEHPWFKGLDLVKLRSKEVEAPFIPDI